MYVKKISYIGIVLVCIISINSNGMVSRVYQRGQQIGARAAAIPGRVGEKIKSYCAKIKGYTGIAEPGSIKEQIMPYAHYPIIYKRGGHWFKGPPNLIDQAKLVDPLLKTEKILIPLTALMALTSTAMLTSGHASGLGGIIGSIVTFALFYQTMPYKADPFLAARSILKQAILKGYLTNQERLQAALSKLLSSGFDIDPSDFPVDIINEPLLDGQTLLQQLLVKTEKSGLISFAISYGADPQAHAASTLHPIEIVLNELLHSERSLTLLALVNPYITQYQHPIPADIVEKLMKYVDDKRTYVIESIKKSSKEGYFELDNNKKAYYANELLALNQIEEALALRGNIPASQIKSPFIEE
ncbi:MAG TPA: hypothetical protein VGW78_07015 [Candidatus Babeliales bacterium]|nr:hypothetical protein [Candidatus Babeliales bacterium]